MEKRTTKKGYVIAWGEEMPYKDYLNHWMWKDKARWIKHIFKNQCQRCGETKNLQVHHLNYKSLGNENKDDVTVLCKDCHKQEHRNKNEK